LRRHIIWEEELLFPLFERKTGMTSGPTQVMRMEHRQIGRDLDAIHHKVHTQDADTDTEEHSLLEVLSRHNLKEEKILYPAIDQAMNESDRASLFDAMRKIPEAGHATCCDEGETSGG
jgi:iron-sulfur cluster repair protein YtfE (RIC family)